MTASEAFERLIKEKHPFELVKCRSCLDFGSFYVFCLAPLDVKDSDEYLTGTIFESVDKKTGRVFEYDITSDIDAYDRAKNVSVTTFLDTPISNVSI